MKTVRLAFFLLLGLGLVTALPGGVLAQQTLKVNGPPAQLTLDSGHYLGSFSPGGSKIVYTAADGIYTMNVDGTNKTKISSSGTRPKWGPPMPGYPEGLIALAGTGITIIRPDGTPVKTINTSHKYAGTSITGTHSLDWSADGSKIAFADQAGTMGIWVIGFDGTGLTQITDYSRSAYSPAWSPDGTEIACSWGGSDPQEIGIFKADGTGFIRAVTSDGRYGGEYPDWGTGGILYSVGDAKQLRIVNSDGTGDRKVFDGPAAMAAWSPDGKRVAYLDAFGGNARTRGYPYTNIQDAVGAAGSGDVVSVAAGAYAENLTINKSLSLIGARSGVDPRSAANLRTAGSSNESIIDGGGGTNAIKIAADNVTINGFEVKNSSGDCIYDDGSTTNHNITVEYSIIHHSGDEGVQLKNVVNGILDHNLAFDTEGDGLNISYSGSENAAITNNEIYDSQSVDGAIQFDEGGGIITIENNYIHDCTSAAGIASYHQKSGTPGEPTRVYIRNNTINGNSFDATGSQYYRHGDAINFYSFHDPTGSTDSLIIEGNTVKNNTGTCNGDTRGNSISVYRVYRDHFPPTLVKDNVAEGNSGCGIFLDFSDNKEATAADNTIRNNLGGIYVGGSQYSVIVHNNCVAGNSGYGLTNNSSTSVDATRNYWGAPDGPKNTSTNPAAGGDPVSDRVEYSPWWAKDYAGDPHSSPWTWGANSNIEGAINDLSHGDTLNPEGTFPGKISVSKNVVVKFGTPPAIDSLSVDADSLSLASDVTINGNIELTNGNVVTSKTNKIVLGTAAKNPVETSKGKIIGTVEVTPRHIGEDSLHLLGIFIQPGNDNLGNVGFTRKTGSEGIVTASGNSGIAVTWQIRVDHQPANGRSVTFSWLRDFDNGVDTAHVVLYRSEGSGWQAYAGPFDVSGENPREVTVTVTGFSDWTVGSSGDKALPVQATSFAAKAAYGSVTLTWKTPSEVNNAGFNILREDSGSTAFKLIASYEADNSLKGLGTSTSGKDYSFTDAKVKSGRTYKYRIQSVSTGGTVNDLATLTVTLDIPKTYALFQNYPNPFNPTTTIKYQVPVASQVTLRVYDVLGREVTSLVNDYEDAGVHEAVFNGGKYASGLYFYRLTAQGNDGQEFASIKKFVLMK